MVVSITSSISTARALFWLACSLTSSWERFKFYVLLSGSSVHLSFSFHSWFLSLSFLLFPLFSFGAGLHFLFGMTAFAWRRNRRRLWSVEITLERWINATHLAQCFLEKQIFPENEKLLTSKCKNRQKIWKYISTKFQTQQRNLSKISKWIKMIQIMSLKIAWFLVFLMGTVINCYLQMSLTNYLKK